MRHPNLTKRCERCELIFLIPNIKASVAKDLLIQYFPCTHCGYVRNPMYPKYDRSGRCHSCAIPFAMIDHHAKGLCLRCYNKGLRYKQGSA